MYMLDSSELHTDATVLVYVLRPVVQLVRRVMAHAAQHARKDAAAAAAKKKKNSTSYSNNNNSSKEQKQQSRMPPKRTYACIFVPHTTPVVEQLLEQHGMAGQIYTASCAALGFVPIDNDVASLCQPDAFAKLALHKQSERVVFDVAASLHRLQRLHGVIPHIQCVGRGAVCVQQALVALTTRRDVDTQRSMLDAHLENVKHHEAALEEDELEQQQQLSEIQRCIIVDRRVDPLTPLLMQLTYAGLLDELFGIRSGFVTLPWSLPSAAAAAAAAAKHSTHDDDTNKEKKEKKKNHAMAQTLNLAGRGDPGALFHRIRDISFAAVLQNMKRVVADVSAQIKSKDELKPLSMKEFKTVVRGAQAIVHQKDSVSTHIKLSEAAARATDSKNFSRTLALEAELLAAPHHVNSKLVRSSLEELIVRHCPLPMVLRLLAAHCLATSSNGSGGGAGGNGLTSQDLRFFSDQVLQTYGYQHLLTLDNMRRLGLLFSSSTATATAASRASFDWAALRKTWRLMTTAAESGPGAGAGAGGGNSAADPLVPRHISFLYSYSGYVPLSVRLFESVYRLNSVAEIEKKTSLKQKQKQQQQQQKQGLAAVQDFVYPQLKQSVAAAERVAAVAAPVAAPADAPATLVYFVGGVTHSELAGMRFVHRQHAEQCKKRGLPAPGALLFATTNMCNGNTMLQHGVIEEQNATSLSFLCPSPFKQE
jgi:hypothetical protein